MSNKLLGDWRLRVLDPNGDPFSEQARVSFFDTQTMSPKEVFADIDSAVSLGSIVDLDAQGYVPVSGVWLAEGAYTAKVEVYSYTDNLNVDHYDVEYVIPRIEGADGSNAGSSITTFDTVEEMRAFSPNGDNGYCHGYNVIDDRGDGHFYWNALSIQADDEGAVIKPTSYSEVDAGRWIRVFEGIPTVRKWGVNESQSNCKVRILNAQDYTVANGSQLTYPKGNYNLQTENLTVQENGIIEDGCFFETTGDVFLQNYDIPSMSKIADNLKVVNLSPVKPEWFGAIGDGAANDGLSFRDAYLNNVTYGSDVYLTKNYFVNSMSGFNVNQDASSIFASESKVTISVTQALSSFGEIKTEGNSKDIIDGSLEFLIPYNGYRSSYIANLDSIKLGILFNDSSWVYDFIWDTEFVFESNYTDVSKVTHLFDGGKWGFNTGVIVNSYTNRFDVNDFIDLNDIEQLGGSKNEFYSSNSKAFVLTALNLVSSASFDHVTFSLEEEAGISAINSLEFDHCTFINNHVSNATTNLNVEASSLNVTDCKFQEIDLSLVTLATTGNITNYCVSHCDFFQALSLGVPAIYVVSNAVDAQCKGLFINNNKFQRVNCVLSTTVGVGTWKNTLTDENNPDSFREHQIDISNNVCQFINGDYGEPVSTEYRGYNNYFGVISYFNDDYAKPTIVPPFGAGIDYFDISDLFVLLGNTNAIIDVDVTAGIARYADISDVTLGIQPLSLFLGVTAARPDSEKVNPNFTWQQLNFNYVELWKNVIEQPPTMANVELNYAYRLNIYGGRK